MSRTNKTRHMKWHKTCKYECRLDSIVCNNKQRWNKNKYPRFVHVFIEKKNSIKSVSGWSMYLQKKKISIKSVPGLFGQPVQERSFNTTLSLGYFGYKCAFGCFGSKIKAASPKNFCHAKRILTVKEVGRLSESVKKGKFMTNLFSHNVE